MARSCPVEWPLAVVSVSDFIRIGYRDDSLDNQLSGLHEYDPKSELRLIIQNENSLQIEFFSRSVPLPPC